ncbi:MAG: hypothetical protein IPF99_27915 [Deltaproteobacteria bacterium]|nr:hypothetical protein [Deltaproteobacteria bacterium]
MLNVEVRAAPWVGVTEVRVIVNGTVARTITGAAIQQPIDPYGHEGVLRWRGSIPLSELTGGRDAWVVVEAGMPIPRAADIADEDGYDGYIDHVDGDGDGAIDDTGMLRPPRATRDIHWTSWRPGAFPSRSPIPSSSTWTAAAGGLPDERPQRCDERPPRAFAGDHPRGGPGLDGV